MASPNTVWNEESSAESFSPVGRWRTKLSPAETAALEALIGDGLEEFGYPLTAEGARSTRLEARLNLMRILYPLYFEAKVFLQSKTLLGRLAKGTRLELTDPVHP